jgi:S-adenosylmethionine hydrolase
MPVVTFTTDWGTSDFYAGALKGAILTRSPQAAMVDISHHITQHDEAEAAFTLRNAYPHFPKGSIHIIGVNSEAGGKAPLLLMEADSHHFIGAGSSCLSLLFLPPACVVSVAPDKKVAGFGMLGAAPHLVHQLLQGAPVKELGTPAELATSPAIEPVINRKPDGKALSIMGRILHVDAYGNIITNIAQALYNEHAAGRACTVLLNSNRYKVPQIYTSYADVEMGNPVAFFNSLGLLEVAASYGNASHLYRLDKENSTITVMFQ